MLRKLSCIRRRFLPQINRDMSGRGSRVGDVIPKCEQEVSLFSFWTVPESGATLRKILTVNCVVGRGA